MSLRPYVAQLHATWLRDMPEERHRVVPATLVFADISGFTPLTERLARRGRVGAEALTDVLNAVFGELLAQAAAHGGDLLKFGGDALLLLFDGEAHQRRACAAAGAMQAALRRWRRLPTEAGTVSLRMSVGVASGDLHAFLVGDRHRELLVAGPLVSRVVALEAIAEAGEVLVDGAVAAQLEARECGAGRGEATLLARAPIMPVRPTANVETDPVDGVPVLLREYLRRRSDDGEHRQVVATFLQFSGVDALLADAGVAAAADALDQLVRRVQVACEEHGVCFLATDVGADGGKILLSAGAPVGSADDADRTLVTLLDVVGAPSPLTVRAGVNAGPAFAVDVGSPLRRTYAVMGDTTNLAARVMGKAGPGQVVATQAVLQRARGAVQHEPLAPFPVKGKSELVLASVIRAVRAPDSERSGVLLGRDEEGALLAGLLDEARAGRGGAVTLVGEAGIGKSALVEHATARAGALPVLRCAAAPYAAVSPYFAVRGPLRELLGIDDSADADRLVAAVADVDKELVEWAPLIGVVLGISVPPTGRTRSLAAEFRRARAHEAVDSLVGALLPAAALIVVEDAHWLDEASAALLRHLVARASERGWAVLDTTRSAEQAIGATAGGHVITLRPLATAEVAALAGEAVSDLPRHMRERLAERSGGNPLFLLSLVEAARQGADPEVLPDTLEALMAARIDALPAQDRSLVRHASVFGHRFSATMLAELADLDPAAVQTRLAALTQVVIGEGTGYRFVHALVRDAAYTALPYRQRRSLHSRAGDLIEQRHNDNLDEWADLLSLHFEQAQDHARAWRYALCAAARARAAWAPADACGLYHRALRAGRGLALSAEELADVYEQLGECAEKAGQYSEAAAAYAQARRTVRGDNVRSAQLCRKEGWVRERSGRYSAALRWYRRAHRLLDGAAANLPIRFELALAEGAARLRQGRYLQALPLLHTAVAGALEHHDETTLAHAYYLLDWAYTDLGHADAVHYRELSLPIYEKLGDLGRQGVVLNNLGIDAYVEGRWADAVQLYERGRAASAQAGDVVHAATAANNIGEMYSDQGRLAEAEELFRDALATWRRAPFPVGVWLATSNLARVAARAGRFEEAARGYAAARAGFAQIGADGYIAETMTREVELHVLAGEPDRALELADAAQEHLRRIGGLGHLTLMLTRLRGSAVELQGRHADAVELLRKALGDAEASGHLFEQALCHQALRQRGAAVVLFQRLGIASTGQVSMTEDAVVTA